MLELPLLEVGVQALVHGVLTEVGHQVVHHQGGLHVDRGAVVDRGEGCGGLFDGLIKVAARVEAITELVLQAMSIAQASCDLPEEGNAQVETTGRIARTHVAQFHEAVHAFIHPRMIALVAAEDAVEPVVAHLMRDHIVQAHGIARVTDDGDHRVFHAAARADGAVQRGGPVVGVVAYELTVEPHALVHVLHGLVP